MNSSYKIILLLLIVLVIVVGILFTNSNKDNSNTTIQTPNVSLPSNNANIELIRSNTEMYFDNHNLFTLMFEDASQNYKLDNITINVYLYDFNTNPDDEGILLERYKSDNYTFVNTARFLLPDDFITTGPATEELPYYYYVKVEIIDGTLNYCSNLEKINASYIKEHSSYYITCFKVKFI